MMTEDNTQQSHKDNLASTLEGWIKQEVHRQVTEHLSSSEFFQALAQKIAQAKGAIAHPHMERKDLE